MNAAQSVTQTKTVQRAPSPLNGERGEISRAAKAHDLFP